jgi:hypothetical protein
LTTVCGVIVDAASFEEAFKIANLLENTTDNGVSSYFAEMMIQRGIATRVETR